VIQYLYTFYLIVKVLDTKVCQVWLSHPPTRADIIAACSAVDLSKLRLEIVTYEDGDPVCTLRGVDIYHWPLMCEHDQSLDMYVLRLIRPEYETVACAVTVDHEGEPTADEVIESCGVDAWLNTMNGSASLAFSHQTKIEPPPIVCPAPDLPMGTGLYDQAYEAKNLWTDKPYTWLASRLIWYGLVRPECPGGYSGISPVTGAADACGMVAARPDVIQWQNLFDEDIYAAAVASKVPARLLKRMIGLESQFWPMYVGKLGEMGLMQVSENGADVLMRFDAAFKPWYPSMSIDDQFWLRLAVRNSFDCPNCDLSEAIDKTRELIPLYARLLAAYRCRAASITPGLSGKDAWQQAVVDYNGSGEYLLKIEAPQ
jgi:hypothetical protein